MSVTVIVRYQAKPDKIDALLDFLTDLQPKLLDAGCKRISLLQDRVQKNLIFEIEQWESAESHEAMVNQAEEASEFDQLAELLETPYAAYTLDTIHAMRGS